MVHFLPFNGINMIFARSFHNANESVNTREIVSPCTTANGALESANLPVPKTESVRNIGWRGNCAMIPIWKGRNFSSC